MQGGSNFMSLWVKSSATTIQMKATGKYYPTLLFLVKTYHKPTWKLTYTIIVLYEVFTSLRLLWTNPDLKSFNWELLNNRCSFLQSYL